MYPIHSLYKEIGKLILEKYGCSSDEIFEEYPVEINGKIFRIDLVGVKRYNDHCRVIAMECGTVGYQKVNSLREEFDEVLIIDDRWTAVNFLMVRKDLDDAIEKNKQLLQWIEELTGEVKDEGEPKSEMLRIRCTKKVLDGFKSYVNEKHHKSYNDALKTLLNEYGKAIRRLERLRVAVS